MSQNPDRSADSAGQPWAGREFQPNPSANDDGSAPAELMAAIDGFHSGALTEVDVIDAVRRVRLLIPLLAQLEELTAAGSESAAPTTSEFGIVLVSAPDGRRVLPVFSSVETMAQWNPAARPFPASGPRVALAAASEETDLVVIDPGSSTEFAVRRPALWAIAQSQPWTPSYRDPDVLQAFMDAAAPEPAVLAVTLGPGDPTSRLRGAELVVRLALTEGLDRASLDAVVARLQERWTASETIAERVDSMRVQLLSVD